MSVRAMGSLRYGCTVCAKKAPEPPDDNRYGFSLSHMRAQLEQLQARAGYIGRYTPRSPMNSRKEWCPVCFRNLVPGMHRAFGGVCGECSASQAPAVRP